MKKWASLLLPGVAPLLVIGLFLAVQNASARPALQEEAEAARPSGETGILSPSSLLFSYQGQLLDAAGEPVDGGVGMTFSLYAAETGGTALWTETYTATEAVSVTNGIFHVLLGSLSPIDPADLTGDAYLELAVNGEVLSPRELLMSVAYAVEARTLPAGAVTRGAITVAGDLGADGNLSIKGSLLHVNSDADVPMSQIKFNNNDYISFDDGGSGIFPQPGGFSLDVDGVTGNALLQAGGAYLNTSYDSAYKFKVAGDTAVLGSLQVSYDDTDARTTHIYVTDASDPNQKLYVGIDGDDEYASIQYLREGDHWGPLALQASGGLVGIGTASPTEKLHINGSVRVEGNIDLTDGYLSNVSRLRSDTSYIGFYKTATATAQSVRAGSLGIDNTYANADTKLTALGGSSLWVKDKLQTGSDVKVGGFLHLGGTDFIMDEYGGRGGGRAMVNDVNDMLTINYDYDFAGGVKLNGPVTCGALVEANLQTEDELEAGQIDRFEEGDVLCWSPEVSRLEKCARSADPLVQAVADPQGRPIVIGAEVIKVLGPVKAGDYLVASDVPGYAVATANPTFGIVIAQALEDFDGERGLIKAMIRKM
ncbi:MAG: hypothetical protein JXA93_01050 [Anaerolineae bacterium]|nr:hypothetical protein [Anaerolineae bacterium]